MYLANCEFSCHYFYTAAKDHSGIFDAFLVEYLRSNYIETRYIPEGKEWPPNQPKYYVNLAVIHYHGSRTQEEVIFSASHYKHLDIGNHNEREFLNDSGCQSRFSNKFRITRELIDLFTMDQCVDKAKSTDHFPRSILIEGAPGVGKTILLKEIAYQWAKNILLANARIVFLIYLRDPRFHSVTTINELIQYFDCLDENEIPAVVKQLRQSNGEGVIFLIDGLDEYPGALQNTFLIRLINRKILSKCAFVITSRPCASVSLQNKVEQRIEILGFGKEERDEYISKSLNSSAEKRELELYFKQHPMLDSLVYIPFHLSILLFLFQQRSLPKTLTEMNELFILHTVYRHMEKHDLPSSCIVKLDNLPKFAYDILYKLSNIAFKGLLENQLVFTFDEIKLMCPEIDIVPGTLNGFGLLNAVQHYPRKGAGVTVSFNFLHLIMQEYLAAWYISHCSVEQQKQSLKYSFLKNEFWDELDDSNARMWQMYLGIVGVNCDAWVQFTTECNLSLNQISDPLEHIYYFQCLSEGGSEHINLVSSVFQNNKLSFISRILLPYHIAMLCLFLFKSTKQWKHYDFYGNSIGDAGIKVLTNFLLANEKILKNIELFDLSCNYLTSQSATAISSVIQKGNITILDISCNDLGEIGALEISKALKINSTLKIFVVSLNDIGVYGAKSLAAALCHNCTLVRLTIGNNKIMDDGLLAISECFKIVSDNKAKLTGIKSLDISANCLTSHSSTAVTTIIQQGALTSLALSYNNLNESGAYEISKALQTNLTLTRLFLCSNNIGARGTLSIAVALYHNITLEYLDISKNKVLDDGAIAIAECLKINKALKSLDMSHNNITEIGANELVEILKINPSIKSLHFDKECIEIFKPYNKQFVYNEAVGRYYCTTINSSDPTYLCDQDFSLIREWINDNISYVPILDA